MQIEMTKRLFLYAQTVRCSKKNPDLAPAAAQREIEFKQELEELEKEQKRLRTPELALAGAGK